MTQSNQKDPAGHSDSEVLSLKEIYTLLKKEIEMAALQSIPPDTFVKIAATLGELKGQGYEGVEAKVRDQLAELVAESARLLLATRQQKLLESNDIDYSKLTDEEKYIHDGFTEWASRSDTIADAASRGRPKVLESISARIRSKRVFVRFLKPTRQFIGIDLARYGPFEEEDIASLPLENARALVKSGEAVQVQIQ
jgi:DNA replication factor GINS